MSRPVTRARALVLRRIPYSESSLVVHVLTAEQGRVALLARGAYRPTSRFYAVLDLLDTLDLEWTTPRGRSLAELRAGDLARRRARLARDLGGYRAALSMLELSELGARPAQPEPALFARLERGLDRLLAGIDPDLARVAFELGFLHDHGLSPALAGCAACGGEAPPPRRGEARAAFSAGAGGRLCPPCAVEARASGRRVGTLPLDVLECAGALAAAELAAPGEPARPLPAVPPARMVRVRDFVERFTSYHLETRPRTMTRFLSVPDRNARGPARRSIR